MAQYNKTNELQENNEIKKEPVDIEQPLPSYCVIFKARLNQNFYKQDAIDVVFPVLRQEHGIAEGVDDIIVVGAHARVVEIVDKCDAAHLATLDVRSEQRLHAGGGAVSYTHLTLPTNREV